MTTLSSAGWVVHELGLAASIGGGLFGQAALEPALRNIEDAQERDEVSETAWRRFSWLNVAGHVAFTVPWLIGRSMLSGREAGAHARALTRTKDVLVGFSVVTGIASFVIGHILTRKMEERRGPERAKAGEARARESKLLERAVGVLGAANLLSTSGIAAVTALLAMESSESPRFAATARRLP
ncbi:MAG TPA: hypothetical protein VGE78_01030 [Agromyces sp.]